MNVYRADLHTHTVLSPCGDLEMSPVNIIERACQKGIHILGVTDHNSTLHAPLLRELGHREGIEVLMGAEVTTREEVHCLCFFEDEEKLNCFQQFLDEHIPQIPNNVQKFGYQVVVNEREEIIDQVEWLLISALDVGINTIEQKVHSLQGLFIPAHINRKQYGLISQLGFVPPDLNVDALELSFHISRETFLQQNGYLKDYTFIQSSDAHYIEDVGRKTTKFQIKKTSFQEVRMALKGEKGREVLMDD